MNLYKDLIQRINIDSYVTSPRGMLIKERIGERLEVTNNEVIINSELRNTTNNKTPEGKYLRAEFMWYMSGHIYPDYIALFGKMWDKLRNPIRDELHINNVNYANAVNSNYGYHVFHKDVVEQYEYDRNNSPFKYVIKTLEKDIHSRQAIIQYTLPVIYEDNIKDFTCTQNQHFLVREGKLFNLIHIRSSDAIKGLTFDIPWWDIVAQFLSRILNVQYEYMQVNIGSAHFYERDFELIDKLTKTDIKWNRLILRDNAAIIDGLIGFLDLILYKIDEQFKKNNIILNINMKDNFEFVRLELEKMKYSHCNFMNILDIALNIADAFVSFVSDNHENKIIHFDKECLNEINTMYFDSFFDIL